LLRKWHAFHGNIILARSAEQFDLNMLLQENEIKEDGDHQELLTSQLPSRIMTEIQLLPGAPNKRLKGIIAFALFPAPLVSAHEEM
jgi:hypothetical protein